MEFACPATLCCVEGKVVGGVAWIERLEDSDDEMVSAVMVRSADPATVDCVECAHPE